MALRRGQRSVLRLDLGLDSLDDAPGFIGPPLYGAMIESGSRTALFGAYAFAAVLMLVAALVTLFLGVDAERKPLEEVCTPLGCEPSPNS